MSKYEIIDEPAPGALAQLSTNPMWPLLAVMVASPVYGWLWFIINSFAIGSPTKIREIIVSLMGMVFISFFYLFLSELKQSETIYLDYIEYIRFSGVIVYISISYYLFVVQTQPFQLYEYFNGKVINGVPVLVIGFIFGNELQTHVITSILRGVV